MDRKKAFTLIELMIAITIIAVLTMASYAPYNYYQNKAKLKVSARDISQLLYESRNMALNGAVSSSSNVSIGVYFDNSVSGNDKIKVFSYPYDIQNVDINIIESADIKLLKTILLKKGVQIEKVEGKDNFLFFFEAITGKLSYYTWNGGSRATIDLNIPDSNIIDIIYSYKGSSSPNLNKSLNYFTFTNIIDY